MKGKASGFISSIPITNKSYPIELLLQRFGNETLLINEHMCKLLNLPKVTSCDDMNGLWMLEDHNVHSESYGVTLKTTLLQNLPYELVLKFN